MQEQEARKLVLQAFALARDSDKRDWHRMTVAVLKNRLLALTDRRFKEADYGAASTSVFVRGFPGLLELDLVPAPPVVELLDLDAVDEVAAPTRRSEGDTRVRADLWRSVLDFSSQIQYVWDTELQRARPANEGDTGPRLPTVTQEGIQSWRTEFANRYEDSFDSSDPQLGRLLTWRERGLGTRALPLRLRGPWSARVRDKVIEVLQAWFTEQKLAPPPDLVLRRDRSGEIAERQRSRTALRDLIVECVMTMTEEELGDLRLPPRALLRARDRERRSG